MNDKMQIGELAKLANVTPRTIRYYESLGLLPPAEREGGGFRHYEVETLTRLKKIEFLKNLGFSLDEIASVIELYFAEASNYLGKQKILEILQAHLYEADAKIAALQQFRAETLLHIAKMKQYIAGTGNS